MFIMPSLSMSLCKITEMLCSKTTPLNANASDVININSNVGALDVKLGSITNAPMMPNKKPIKEVFNSTHDRLLDGIGKL